MNAIQSAVFMWFPKSERTAAFSVVCFPFALATVVKYSFISLPKHEYGVSEETLTASEIAESLLICLVATLAILFIKDKPKVFPSFLAMHQKESLGVQWKSMSSNGVFWAILTLSFTVSSIYAGEYRNERNVFFALGVVIGSVIAFRLAVHADGTSTHLVIMRRLVISLAVLRAIEVIYDLFCEAIAKDFVLQVVGIAIGMCTMLVVPIVLSFVADQTYPVVTSIPNLLMFWTGTSLAVVISGRLVAIELAPLLISAVLVLWVREDQDDLDSPLNTPASLRRALIE
jgi:hypothetical protein